MKIPITIGVVLSQIMCVYALNINEIMSNPIGDDGGREWIELYNNSDNEVNLSSLTISIKGGSFLVATPVSGGVTLAPRTYAVIGSTLSGATRFMLDYPSFSGPLFKSSISLVNTGVTSVEVKVDGVTVDTLASYTAAKEGETYSLINGSFTAGLPTPGAENQVVVQQLGEATTSPTSSQSIAKTSAPSSDIVLYLPLEKTVVAGAPSLFSVSSLTHAGKVIEGMTYAWSFGDGGERTGSSTVYRYLYPGRYVVNVEGTNGLIAGVARMNVRVVSPDLTMSTISQGKYGNYIDITNSNMYDLDMSGWKISIDGALFSFPKNTLLSNGTTRFSGVAMGFASTTVSSSTLIKLLFPSMEEVLRVNQGGTSLLENIPTVPTASKSILTANPVIQQKNLFVQPQQKKSMPPKTSVIATSSRATTTKTLPQQNKKDTRLALFLKSLFSE